MKSKDIITPAHLIVGDIVVIVSWEKHKATPSKIEKVAVKEIFKENYLNKMYGPGENGLGIEWDKRRWHFSGYGAWDLRKVDWNVEFNSYNSRGFHKLFRLDKLIDAEQFAKNEVPKLQLEAVIKRIEGIKKNFNSKLSEMEELEKTLQNNCNTIQIKTV